MTKFYTSYFANYRKFPEDAKLYSIARFTPKSKQEIKQLIEFAPSEQLLMAYKDGLIDRATFKEEYIRGLNNLHNLSSIISYLLQEQKVIFLCYEKKGDFCHRQILAWYLHKYFSIDVEEL